AFCRGASGALPREWNRIPAQVRGVFHVRQREGLVLGVRLTDIADGTSNTFAMGDAAGGTTTYPVRDLSTPGQTATDPATGQTPRLERSGRPAGVPPRPPPWYAWVWGGRASSALAPPPRDEPMNRRPATPTVTGGDPAGDNASGKDFISGFRS